MADDMSTRLSMKGCLHQKARKNHVEGADIKKSATDTDAGSEK
jgi:hypothetical protein